LKRRKRLERIVQEKELACNLKENKDSETHWEKGPARASKGGEQFGGTHLVVGRRGLKGGIGWKEGKINCFELPTQRRHRWTSLRPLQLPPDKRGAPRNRARTRLTKGSGERGGQTVVQRTMRRSCPHEGAEHTGDGMESD